LSKIPGVAIPLLKGDGYTRLEDYTKLVVRKRCRLCHRPLPPRLSFYKHSEGWLVEGFGRLWLYIECPRCGYQNSLDKLGLRHLRDIDGRGWQLPAQHLPKSDNEGEEGGRLQ
jgi:hypothetical protein